MGLGKWIGGIVGFMAGGPLGALAGYAIGSLFEKVPQLTNSQLTITTTDSVIVSCFQCLY